MNSGAAEYVERGEYIECTTDDGDLLPYGCSNTAGSGNIEGAVDAI